MATMTPDARSRIAAVLGPSGTYVVQPGDTLWSIAKRAYGDPNRFRDIAGLNKILDANRLMPGEVLRLPDAPPPPQADVPLPRPRPQMPREAAAAVPAATAAASPPFAAPMPVGGGEPLPPDLRSPAGRDAVVAALTDLAASSGMPRRPDAAWGFNQPPSPPPPPMLPDAMKAPVLPPASGMAGNPNVPPMPPPGATRRAIEAANAGGRFSPPAAAMERTFIAPDLAGMPMGPDPSRFDAANPRGPGEALTNIPMDMASDAWARARQAKEQMAAGDGFAQSDGGMAPPPPAPPPVAAGTPVAGYEPSSADAMGARFNDAFAGLRPPPASAGGVDPFGTRMPPGSKDQSRLLPPELSPEARAALVQALLARLNGGNQQVASLGVR